MSRGTKIIILIVAGLVVIGLIIYYIIVPVIVTNQPPAPVNVNKNLSGALPKAKTPPPVLNKPVVPPPVVTPEAMQASSARTIAIAFSERFATYSNQNNLANLENLEAISTPALWSFIQGSYRAGLIKTLPAPQNYYAMTSTALNANVASMNATEDSATVMMQRVESGTVSKVTYATLDLKLKKSSGGSWLVSWEEWEK